MTLWHFFAGWTLFAFMIAPVVGHWLKDSNNG